jgi:hypothetical protein
MNNATTFGNLAVLANAVNIATEIVSNVSGNEVSNHLEGTPVNDRTIGAICAADINNLIEGRDNA